MSRNAANVSPLLVLDVMVLSLQDVMAGGMVPQAGRAVLSLFLRDLFHGLRIFGGPIDIMSTVVALAALREPRHHVLRMTRSVAALAGRDHSVLLLVAARAGKGPVLRCGRAEKVGDDLVTHAAVL